MTSIYKFSYSICSGALLSFIDIWCDHRANINMSPLHRATLNHIFLCLPLPPSLFLCLLLCPYPLYPRSCIIIIISFCRFKYEMAIFAIKILYLWTFYFVIIIVPIRKCCYATSNQTSPADLGIIGRAKRTERGESTISHGKYIKHFPHLLKDILGRFFLLLLNGLFIVVIHYLCVYFDFRIYLWASVKLTFINIVMGHYMREWIGKMWRKLWKFYSNI